MPTPPPLSFTDRCLLVAPNADAPLTRPPIAPPPPSALAARLAAFLPELAAANAALEEAVAAGRGEEFNMEAVAEGGAHVAMEVAAGVVDLKDGAALAAAEAALAQGGGGGGDDGDNGEGGGGSASSESSSESDDDDGGDAAEPAAAPRLKRSRLAPGIKILD